MQATVEVVRAHAFDVVVCGGGPAGFCAAIAAARNGARTVLLEQNGALGGTMPLGGINAPALFHAHGKQVIAGIGWELMERLANAGHASLPVAPFDAPHPMLAVELNPFQAAVEMDCMAEESGVEVRFYQPVASVLTKAGHVEAVLAVSPQGLERFEGKVFIDCTGDAALCYMAGAECEIGEELQPATLSFRMENAHFHPEQRDAICEKYQTAVREGRLKASDIWGGSAYAVARVFKVGPGRKVPEPMPTISYPYNAADSASRSRGEVEGRQYIARLVKWLNEEVPGYENAFVSGCPAGVAPRESRRVLGNAYITVDDYIHGVCPKDSVCYSFYPIDLHRGDTRSALDNEFHSEGRVPGIPYGALVARGFDNLMMAGRNASGDRRAHSAYRVQATCMVMG